MRSRDTDKAPADAIPRRYSNDGLRESIETARRAAERADRTSLRVARHITRAEAFLRFLRVNDHRRYYLG